ncbi:DUF732 domain-containing protein [Crossiella sp. SN42]|uniref:DUF732 domain-containing protein n=1 Tax=Crossiella sp. SN42 TaxID=2944808 RepID=UPI00207CA4B4|nr:DUF732 domain-containing protein [Crossiella sp. SN42]MCO1575606.1 DUF732 domain-containing protein [Crossiella sp. SN42]
MSRMATSALAAVITMIISLVALASCTDTAGARDSVSVEDIKFLDHVSRGFADTEPTSHVIETGHEVCWTQKRGQSILNAWTRARRDYSTNHASVIVVAAVRFYCPQFQSALDTDPIG